MIMMLVGFCCRLERVSLLCVFTACLVVAWFPINSMRNILERIVCKCQIKSRLTANHPTNNKCSKAPLRLLSTFSRTHTLRKSYEMPHVPFFFVSIFNTICMRYSCNLNPTLPFLLSLFLAFCLYSTVTRQGTGRERGI